MSEVKKALIFINPHKTAAPILAKEIEEKLLDRDIDVFSCAFEEKPEFNKESSDYDIAFTLGGDGTALFAARSVAHLEIPMLPVNLGTFGFIASVPPSDWLKVFNLWLERSLEKSIEISQRLMLEVNVERKGVLIFKETCLNDAVISTGSIAKVIALRVESNNMKFGKYLSDGLIAATPTGSTAYSLSAGGPILDPEISAIIINPICPFTLSNRPIVISSKETVLIDVEKEQRSKLALTLDGQIVKDIEPEDRIYIKESPYKARFIASGRAVFYKALRTKLSWSGGPDA